MATLCTKAVSKLGCSVCRRFRLDPGALESRFHALLMEQADWNHRTISTDHGVDKTSATHGAGCVAMRNWKGLARLVQRRIEPSSTHGPCGLVELTIAQLVNPMHAIVELQTHEQGAKQNSPHRAPREACHAMYIAGISLPYTADYA